MDWFMIAFVGILCILVAYYIERQIHDPGVKVFPFNTVDKYSIAVPKEDGESKATAQ